MTARKQKSFVGSKTRKSNMNNKSKYQFLFHTVYNKKKPPVYSLCVCVCVCVCVA